VKSICVIFEGADVIVGLIALYLEVSFWYLHLSFCPTIVKQSNPFLYMGGSVGQSCSLLDQRKDRNFLLENNLSYHLLKRKNQF
jgi:hypothetical protein